MFVFLSKLLPLFIYPLGLACLLLVTALVLLMWRQVRWAMVAIALALVIILGASNGWISAALVKSLEDQAIALQESTSGLPYPELPAADAIVVLGGGIKAPLYPRQQMDLAEEGDRVLYGARLWKAGKAPMMVMTGGRIQWRGTGDAKTGEAGDMAELAATLGVPADKIVMETASLNTRQNATYTAQVLDGTEVRRILLVTSAMHMPRSWAIFKRAGFEPIAAPTDFLITDADNEERGNTAAAIALNLMPDADNLRGLTRALKEYVGTFVYWIRGWL
ncbi:MAG: YdcF family protein [Cyanobacteria bacterium P01_D01_bin.73]